MKRTLSLSLSLSRLHGVSYDSAMTRPIRKRGSLIAISSSTAVASELLSSSRTMAITGRNLMNTMTESYHSTRLIVQRLTSFFRFVDVWPSLRWGSGERALPLLCHWPCQDEVQPMIEAINHLCEWIFSHYYDCTATELAHHSIHPVKVKAWMTSNYVGERSGWFLDTHTHPQRSEGHTSTKRKKLVTLCTIRQVEWYDWVTVFIKFLPVIAIVLEFWSRICLYIRVNFLCKVFCGFYPFIFSQLFSIPYLPTICLCL